MTNKPLIPAGGSDIARHRIEQPVIGFDMGIEPAAVMAVVTDPPYGGIIRGRRVIDVNLRKLDQGREALRMLCEQQMQPYQAELEDRLSGLNRLARARRLIAKGGNRPMKRARRLYRLVYGPRHYAARFQIARSFIRAEQIFRGLARSFAMSTAATAGFSELLRKRLPTSQDAAIVIAEDEVDRIDG